MPPDAYQAAHSDQDENKYKKRYDKLLIIKMKSCLLGSLSYLFIAIERATLKIAAFSTRLVGTLNLNFSRCEDFNQDLIRQTDVHL